MVSVSSLGCFRFTPAAAILAIVACHPAVGATIQFGGGGPVVAGPGPVLAFPAQANPGGLAWDTTAGTVIVDVVPGVSATLTLTGTPGVDGVFGTADDIPFDIILDRAGGVGDAVVITFDSGAFGPIGPPAFDSASLNGTVVSANALLAGVELQAFAFGAGPFGVVGPFAGPGAFAGAIGPVPELGPPVLQLQGILSFTFGPLQVDGDLVRLPASAVVRTVVPEPSTAAMMLISAAGVFLGLCRRRRKPM